MISNPRQGQRALIWYATRARGKGGVVPASVMPLHGAVCRVVAAAGRGGGPRNPLVEIVEHEANPAFVGRRYAIPAGNLQPAPAA